MTFMLLVASAAFFAAAVVIVFETMELRPFDGRQAVEIFVGAFAIAFIVLSSLVMV